jgi:predicted MFS family arabinose efflux permease
LICSVVIGAYFVYDYPGILQASIMKDFDVSTTTYGLLYSVYSMPNIILPVFTGVLITGMGKGWSVIVFAGLVFLGNSLMILGPLLPNYWLVVVGRCVYGIGSETVMVM